ncbi:hypothetical protein O5169_07375 [Escherichia coli]|nr:hypothetical protein [Escherichia coli]
MQRRCYGQFENTFHDVPRRACANTLPQSQLRGDLPKRSAIYKREEDGIVLIDQDKCRGWRLCTSGCPYKKSTSTGKAASQENASSVTHEVSPVNRPCCSETAGSHPHLGVLLYDAEPHRGSGEHRARGLTSMNASAKCSSIH